MRYSPSEPGLQTKYIRHPADLEGNCFCCGHALEDAYVTAGHRYHDFAGDVNEIRYLMRCTNSACILYNRPYNSTPSEVLPFKQNSFAVWKWIAEEAILYNQNPEQIHNRILERFELNISKNTIRNYIDEIEVLVSHEIDEKTRKLLKIQGIIILALDGQKPEENGKALWLFVDLLSNRILKVVILESADSETLHKLVEDILNDFQVKLVGLVSDKQNNLTKLHDDWYSDVPHQYCHFHFLQNIWNHIEVKDTALRTILAKGIKKLYICSVSKQVTRNFEALGTQQVREVFKKIEQKLRRIVKGQTKKFEKLGGVNSYHDLMAYWEELERKLNTEQNKTKDHQILIKTANDIKQILQDTQNVYEDCITLQQVFEAIREWLGMENTNKGSILSAGDKLFESIWKSTLNPKNAAVRSDLRSFLPQKDKTKTEILRENVRLYDSYRDGLFRYLDFPVKIRTNSPMEQAIGQEKAKLRQRAGKANVGSQIRIRGEYELKKIYVGREELRMIVNRMGPNFSELDLKQGLIALANRRHEETEKIRGIGEEDGLDEVLCALKNTRDA